MMETVQLSSINEAIDRHGSNNQEKLVGLARAVAETPQDPILALALWLHLSRGHSRAIEGGARGLAGLLIEGLLGEGEVH